MFLDCFKNNGVPYLRICEGYRAKKEDGSITVKRKTIKNLGPLSKFDDGQPELLQRLRKQFKEKTLVIDGFDYDCGQVNSDVVLRFDLNKPPVLDPQNIGYFFCESVYNYLDVRDVLAKYKQSSQIEFDVYGITKMLVYSRIMNPQSKKATFEDGLKPLFSVAECKDLNNVYRTLDVLDKCSEKIIKRIDLRVSQSSIGRDDSLMFYDVTNYYFETEYGDEFRKKGVSKEHRPNPIVQMGLFIDRNGIPVSYKLFSGNTQDKTTFTEILDDRYFRSGDQKTIVVADNGMYSQYNLFKLLTSGNGYIISKSVKKSWNRIKDIALDDNGYEEMRNRFGEVVFKSKSFVEECTIKSKEGKSLNYKKKTVIFWSKKHYEKELHDNRKFIEYLESCKSNPDKLRDRQRKSMDFLKIHQIDAETGEVIKTKSVVEIVDEKLQAYQEMMGFYMIETSEIDMSNSEIIERYHGLSRIEDSFRIIKSDLEGRPVYVRTKEHINAHFLICFIALVIIRLMQCKVLKAQGKSPIGESGWEEGIPANRLKKALLNYNVNHLSEDYYQIVNCTEDQSLLGKAFGVDSLSFPTKSQLRKFRSDISKSFI